MTSNLSKAIQRSIDGSVGVSIAEMNQEEQHSFGMDTIDRNVDALSAMKRATSPILTAQVPNLSKEISVEHRPSPSISIDTRW